MGRHSVEKEKIPNFNSFSCLVDRMVIEQVKKTIFELKQEEEKVDYSEKIEIQNKAIKALSTLFTDFCLKTWFSSEYTFIEEARTFKS